MLDIGEINDLLDTEIPEEEFDTVSGMLPVSYTHLRAHETVLDLVCRLLLEKKKKKKKKKKKSK